MTRILKKSILLHNAHEANKKCTPEKSLTRKYMNITMVGKTATTESQLY